MSWENPRRRRRYAPRRRRRSYRLPRFRRWRHRAKIPLIPTVGFGAGLLFGKPDGWSSPIEAIQNGRLDLATQTAIRNVTGIKVPMPNTGYTGHLEFNIGAMLNPLDMNEAPALKGLIWGSLISIALRFLGVNRKFTQMTRKIPILNKFSL
jgi:hypothetical protein